MFGPTDEGYDQLVEEVFATLLEQGFSPNNIMTQFEQRLPGLLPKLGATLVESLKQEAPPMLDDRRSIRERFTRRLQRKWGHPLRLFSMLVEAARESGEDYNSAYRPAAAAEQDFIFEALVRLHARACLIATEVHWLMEGGFASGAMARWRTLHELNAVAYFIENHGTDCAERYLLHHHVETSKSAIQYQQHCQDLGDEPLTDEELEEHRRRHDELCARFGQPYRGDWGWAAAALGNPRPSFADIERAVNLDHMRPYFRFSCFPTHAGSKGIRYDLGTTLTPEDVGILLAGPSDAGLDEPGICTALSLYQLTTTLLMHRDVTLTTLTVVEALGQLQQETQDAFAQASTSLEVRATKVRERLERFDARRRPNSE